MSWPGMQMVPSTTTPRAPPAAPQQVSPPVPAEADGPLNLTKPKGHSGGHSGSGRGSGNYNRNGNNGSGSPSHSYHPNSEGGRNVVPPGLVLPPTFMPFATFPLPSSKSSTLLFNLNTLYSLPAKNLRI